MKRFFLVILAIALLPWVFIGPATAEHNAVFYSASVGADTTGSGPGAPFPTPHAEPNTGEALRPVYHVAGPDETAVPQTYASFGDYARVSPADGDGQYVGEVIGYIDGVVEYQAVPGTPECDGPVAATGLGGPTLPGQAYCSNPNDPLYAARPDPGNDACSFPGSLVESVFDGASRVREAGCDGAGHPWRVNPYDPAKVDAPNPGPLHEGAPVVYPGVYSRYVYLFGAGSGPGVDEMPFADYLPGTLCHDYVEDVTGDAATADRFLPNRGVGCSLVTPGDLARFEETAGVVRQAGLFGGAHNGRTEQAIVCGFGPRSRPTPAASQGACASPGRFRAFEPACGEDSTDANCLNNKPGWYMDEGTVDPTGSFRPDARTATVGGNRSDVARTFTYYASPVPVTSSNWCAAPPVQTTAADGLDTGVQEDASTQDPDDWTVPSSAPEYLLGAHDLDQHRSAPAVVLANRQVDAAVDEANDILDSVPGIDPPDTDEVEDRAGEQVDRADPTVPASPEPNDPRDTTGDLVRRSATTHCPGDARTGLQPSPTPGTRSVGRVQASLGSVAAGTVLGQAFGDGTLHDYTLSDEETPLPEEADEQGQNPWSPDQYSFGGELMVYQDRNGNLTFDGCPNGQVPTTASPDLCQARLPWDAYNARAKLGSDRGTVGEFAGAQGFADPLGLAAVVKVTGPVAVDSLDLHDLAASPPEGALSHLEERWDVLPGTGQKCIVAFSRGLLDAASDVDRDGVGAGSRVRAALGLSSHASPAAVADQLCGPGTDADHVMTDAFSDQTTLGDFSAGFNWVKLQPTPSVAPGAGDDGLTVHAFLTVEEGGDGWTAANLGLGQDATGDNDITNDPTVVEEWADGSVTYQWTDRDRFAG